MSGNYFSVGWNVVGEDIDEDPLIFEYWDQAIDFLERELTLLGEDDDSLALETRSVIEDIQNTDLTDPGRSFAVTVGPFVYYVENSAERVIDTSMF